MAWMLAAHLLMPDTIPPVRSWVASKGRVCTDCKSIVDTAQQRILPDCKDRCGEVPVWLMRCEWQVRCEWSVL